MVVWVGILAWVWPRFRMIPSTWRIRGFARPFHWRSLRTATQWSQPEPDLSRPVMS